MTTNDETLYGGATSSEEQASDNKQSATGNKSLKMAAMGGVPGALAGAGAMYAASSLAADAGDDTPVNENPVNENPGNEGATVQGAEAIPIETQSHDVHVHIHTTVAQDTHNLVADHQDAPAATTNTVSTINEAPAHNDTPATADDDDVHIVGQFNYDGHAAAALDVSGDGTADVVVIDIDDTGDLTPPDVLIDHEGHVATYGELTDAALGEGQESVASIDQNPDGDLDNGANCVDTVDGIDDYGVDTAGTHDIDLPMV